MTPEQARQHITQEFVDNFSTTSVNYPNTSFTEPSDGSAWVQFNILFGDTINLTISSKTNEPLGNVFVNIFTESLSGIKESTDLIAEIRAIYNRLTLSTVNGNVQFETPQVRQIPGVSDSIWFQQSVTIPFFYTETI